MNVAVIGAGYVGLVSGACLAVRGHDVVCVDRANDIVHRLNRGEPHIYERNLTEVLRQGRDAGRFRATMSVPEALDRAELVLLAVGTPTVEGSIDLSAVRTAASEVGRVIHDDRRERSVVVKSTVTPGTTDGVVRQELASAIGDVAYPISLGMNPEFLREGEAVDDFMNPDRIVLGHEDAAALDRLQELYQPWTCDKVVVNTRTAELIKYANNAILATQISVINEIANLAAAIGGIDVMDVVDGVRLDGRWTPMVDGRRVTPGILRYLVPGCGFGGSCFPKDVQALRAQGQELGLDMDLMRAVLRVNDAQPHQVMAILQRELGDLTDRTCLVLGLAFKAGTDDVRESASVPIVRDLVRIVRRVEVHDPVAAGNFRRALGSDSEVGFADDWRRAVAAADIIIVATAWEEYRELATMNLDGKVLFDARRMFTAGTVAGARYLGIGRRSAAHARTVSACE